MTRTCTKRSTSAACWVVIIFAATLLSAPSAAAETMSVDEVVGQALENPDLEGRQLATADEARGRAQTAGQWSNPEFGYTREHGISDSALHEDELGLSQRIPISGRLGRTADAYERRVDAVDDEISNRRRQIALDVRRQSYDLLADQRRLEAYGEVLESLQQLRGSMELRVERGESARFELDRIDREHADLVAEMRRIEARVERQRAELASWLPSVESIRIEDDLGPEPLPDDDELLASARDHPSVQSLDHEAEAADRHRDALSRWYLPDLVVRAGVLREPSDQGSQFGVVAGAALEIPLFDRRQGERRRLEAEGARHRHHRRQREREVLAEARGLAAQTRHLIEAAREYQTEGLDRAHRVRETTRRAYDGDEATILELIDAHRGVLEADLRHIELGREARQGEIELRYYLEPLPTEDSVRKE